jgi:hypothetical protein
MLNFSSEQAQTKVFREGAGGIGCRRKRRSGVSFRLQTRLNAA